MKKTNVFGRMPLIFLTKIFHVSHVHPLYDVTKHLCTSWVYFDRKILPKMNIINNIKANDSVIMIANV